MRKKQIGSSNGYLVQPKEKKEKTKGREQGLNPGLPEARHARGFLLINRILRGAAKRKERKNKREGAGFEPRSTRGKTTRKRHASGPPVLPTNGALLVRH